MGLRWWNEAAEGAGGGGNAAETVMVFESADPAVRTINPTDKRFFWIALYVQPVLWIGMALLAITHPIWLFLVGEFRVGS